ncbi:MAG: hypothetical protein ACM309_09800 [Bacillota bacterium]
MRNVLPLLAALLVLLPSWQSAEAQEPKPDVPAVFESIELIIEPQQTLVKLTVKAVNRFSYALTINPLTESALRDNLGNEYKPLGLVEKKDLLTGKFGGGLMNPEKRSGCLVFPALREGVTTVAFVLPVRRQRTLSQIVMSQLQGDVFTLSKIWLMGDGDIKPLN